MHRYGEEIVFPNEHTASIRNSVRRLSSPLGGDALPLVIRGLGDTDRRATMPLPLLRKSITLLSYLRVVAVMSSVMSLESPVMR